VKFLYYKFLYVILGGDSRRLCMVRLEVLPDTLESYAFGSNCMALGYNVSYACRSTERHPTHSHRSWVPVDYVGVSKTLLIHMRIRVDLGQIGFMLVVRLGLC
jgi:hypothetical protein